MLGLCGGGGLGGLGGGMSLCVIVHFLEVSVQGLWGYAPFLIQNPEKTTHGLTGPVAQAAFAHSPAFGPGLLPRTILQWSPETRTRCDYIIRDSTRQHHPTLKLLLEELLAARRPHACARSYFIRGAIFGRNGSLCVPCD